MNNIKTGDLILVSDYGPLSPLVKVFTLCEYNHSAVAIRLDFSALPEIKLSTNEDGELFVLDKISLKDVTLKQIPTYTGVNKVLRLPLKKELQTQEFEDNLTKFLYRTCDVIEYKGTKITVQKRSTDLPTREHNKFYDMFCSEITFSLYYACFQNRLNQSLPSLITPKSLLFFNQLFEKSSIIYQNPEANYRHLWLAAIVFLVLIILLYLIFRYICRKIYNHYR